MLISFWIPGQAKNDTIIGFFALFRMLVKNDIIKNRAFIIGGKNERGRL